MSHSPYIRSSYKVVNEGAGFGGGGIVTLVVLVDELLEVGEFLGGEDEGLGVDAGFEGIHGGGGFAFDRGGAGGFLRVAAIRFDLTLRGHIKDDSELTGCPTLTIRHGIWEFWDLNAQRIGNKADILWKFVK